MAQITLNSSGVASSGSLLLQTNGTTTQATVDTSGNLGLGVTPSASSNLTNIEMPQGVQIGARKLSGYPQMYLSSNVSGDAYGPTYKINGYATQYRLESSAGKHEWYTAASGTAGNAISFTQAMTLDANGSLLVGETSSPSSTYRGFFKGSNASSDVSVGVRNTDSSGFSRFVLGNNAGVARFTIGYTGSGSSTYSFGASAAWLGTEAAEPLVFQTNGTERARIDSSGRLLVGTTSAFNGSCPVQIKASVDSNQVLSASNSSTNTPYVAYFEFSNAAPNNAGSFWVQCSDNAATRIQLRSNGGIANYSANNVNLSDRREKTNFSPAGDYLSKICAIPVQTYNYIDQNLEEDDGLTLGVVAQDVQAVAPELVMESNWAAEGQEPKMRLSIYQTDLQYALMKCIQEMKTIIDQQAERIAALEAK